MKKLFNFKALAILFLCLFIAGCVLVSETNFSGTLELVVSIASFIFLGASIILFILNRKSTPKTEKPKAYVDDNILAARKIYKNTIKQTILKKIYLTLIVYAAVMLAIIVYYIINFDKLMLIIFSSTSVLMGGVLVASLYFSYKFFFFPYKEFIFNGESIVLFMSDTRLSRYSYNPCFHVVYDCKEHTEYGRSIWTGGGINFLDDVLYASLNELIDWFSDVKYSNFIRININTKNSGSVQCVYKIGSRKFIVSDKLEKLNGCFETSRSMRKAKRSKAKSNKTKKNSD